MDATTTRIRQIATVAIPVSDQDRAIAFYRDVLGFEVRMDAAFGDGDRWVELAPPGAATSLALVPANEGVPTGIDTGIRLTTEDAARDHAAFGAAGVDLASELIPYPVPMFVINDPDRNRLYIVERPKA
jgi:catechol 2,3-dioxygenase-like lactoylglutathione lyase family enzyme